MGYLAFKTMNDPSPTPTAKWLPSGLKANERAFWSRSVLVSKVMSDMLHSRTLLSSLPVANIGFLGCTANAQSSPSAWPYKSIRNLVSDPGGRTPINQVYGDDPLDRVWFFYFFVIDRVSILRFVSSRFEFRVIDRVLG